MKRRIKESKNIFPCTVYMENQDYDEVYYYLDTPEYGLSWRYFDDVEQEDIENYKYIIKNIADLRKAIDDLEEDFIHGYGNSYFKLSENYMEDLLNRGKTLVRVKKEHKERVYIIRVKPAQNVELALAESFEKTIRNLQKEGLFENVSSFDLDFTGRGINIKLNESGSIFSKELLNKLKEEWFEVCKDAVDHNRCYGERCYINKDDVSVYFINASLYKGNYYDIHLNLIKSAKDINYCIKNNTICKAVVFTCNTDFNYGFDGDYIETLCNDYGLKAIFDMDNNFNIEDNEDIIDEILPIEIDSQLDTESTIEVVDWNGNSIYNDGF